MARQKYSGATYELVVRDIGTDDTQVGWHCMFSWTAEYNTLTNTSDWLFEFFVAEYGTNYAQQDGCLEPWSYKITTDFCSLSGTGDRLTQPIQSHEIDVGFNGTGGVEVFHWTKVAEHRLNGVPHTKSTSIYTNRSLEVGYVTGTLDCPDNSVFTNYRNPFTEDSNGNPHYYGTQMAKMTGNNATSTWYPVEFDASDIIASNANIGSNTTIMINNDSTVPVHTVEYCYEEYIDDGNAVTGDNRTWKLIGEEYRTDRQFDWTIPMDFYAEIPNDRQGSVYFRVKTYTLKENEYSQVGTHETAITVYTVEADCKPTLSPTMYDSNSVTTALTGNSNKLVKYKSHATYNANATARLYATIASIEVANGSQTLNTNTGTFYGFTNDYFTFEVVDSRGYSAYISYTPTIIQYVNLTCIAIAEAPTADGDLNFVIQGNYWNGNFGVSSNTLQVFYRIKRISQATGDGTFSNWIEIPFELGANKYTATVSIHNIDYRDTFVIEAYAVDVFGNVYSEEEATSALPIFDWGINDFNMNCDMTVYGTLTVNGNVVATGTVNGSGTGVSSYEIHFGTCQSSGDVGAKLVTCPTFTNLATGSSIRVKFAYANTVANVVMNVNNTGAITVKIDDTNSDLTNAWRKGAVRDFVYDGQNWIMVTY